ncbi:hypothetical protein C8J57DRAFT_1623783 [Mycena rebaudengoi]|nr:hypothetical protein C8J57DRAFT_1623783 [Mycena rebaudengoi]
MARATSQDDQTVRMSPAAVSGGESAAMNEVVVAPGKGMYIATAVPSRSHACLALLTTAHVDTSAKFPPALLFRLCCHATPKRNSGFVDGQRVPGVPCALTRNCHAGRDAIPRMVTVQQRSVRGIRALNREGGRAGVERERKEDSTKGRRGAVYIECETKRMRAGWWEIKAIRTRKCPETSSPRPQSPVDGEARRRGGGAAGVVKDIMIMTAAHAGKGFGRVLAADEEDDTAIVSLKPQVEDPDPPRTLDVPRRRPPRYIHQHWGIRPLLRRPTSTGIPTTTPAFVVSATTLAPTWSARQTGARADSTPPSQPAKSDANRRTSSSSTSHKHHHTLLPSAFVLSAITRVRGMISTGNGSAIGTRSGNASARGVGTRSARGAARNRVAATYDLQATLTSTPPHWDVSPSLSHPPQNSWTMPTPLRDRNSLLRTWNGRAAPDGRATAWWIAIPDVEECVRCHRAGLHVRWAIHSRAAALAVVPEVDWGIRSGREVDRGGRMGGRRVEDRHEAEGARHSGGEPLRYVGGDIGRRERYEGGES